MSVVLGEHQLDAVNKLGNGKILVADTGVGKTRTALAYYYLRVCGGGIETNFGGTFSKMRSPRDLYIITTAKKRDALDWEYEMAPFLLKSGYNEINGVTVHVDSWNNIAKYKKAVGAFFIFDEQRLVGRGKWVKSFWNIARKNKWILLSATPGDKWEDYAAVFIANGFYRNITDFRQRQCIYSPYTKHPQVIGYRDEALLEKQRKAISVIMYVKRGTEHIYEDVAVGYDKMLYRRVWKDRWDPYDNKPIKETSKLFYLLRRVINEDVSRREALGNIVRVHQKVIVFYNFNYELDILREWFGSRGFAIGEWNGKVHSEVPSGERWVYLVQYSAGCEGWNCITTDTMIFYSQSYSYRMTKQAEGRIDRWNTPYTKLYYYKLRSAAPIDIAIARALKEKRNFNFKNFIGRS